MLQLLQQLNVVNLIKPESFQVNPNNYFSKPKINDFSNEEQQEFEQKNQAKVPSVPTSRGTELKLVTLPARQETREMPIHEVKSAPHSHRLPQWFEVGSIMNRQI